MKKEYAHFVVVPILILNSIKIREQWTTNVAIATTLWRAVFAPFAVVPILILISIKIREQRTTNVAIATTLWRTAFAPFAAVYTTSPY
jgi:hypothetical protein